MTDKETQAAQKAYDALRQFELAGYAAEQASLQRGKSK